MHDGHLISVYITLLEQICVMSRTQVEHKYKWMVVIFDPVSVLYIGTYGLSDPQATD